MRNHDEGKGGVFSFMDVIWPLGGTKWDYEVNVYVIGLA